LGWKKWLVIVVLSAVQVVPILQSLEYHPNALTEIAGRTLGVILMVYAVDWVLNKIAERRRT